VKLQCLILPRRHTTPPRAPVPTTVHRAAPGRGPRHRFQVSNEPSSSQPFRRRCTIIFPPPQRPHRGWPPLAMGPPRCCLREHIAGAALLSGPPRRYPNPVSHLPPCTSLFCGCLAIDLVAQTIVRSNSCSACSTSAPRSLSTHCMPLMTTGPGRHRHSSLPHPHHRGGPVPVSF
jgi:hypothetical protein